MNEYTGLIERWEGMSPRDRNLTLAEKVMGWKRWRIRPNDGKSVVIIEHPGATWPISEFFGGEETTDALDEPFDVPRYLDPSSPRSLVDELERKAIEKVGQPLWGFALLRVVADEVGVFEVELEDCQIFSTVPTRAVPKMIRATAEQRCKAIYLAVASQEGK